ncbi:MAG: RNA methyltransferase [Bacteroidia bacterium]|nr:RNA methyltransferase [Bacteroidia bacterium]MDW8014523.1 RNA methyltransferase [Bacteroidia bacterium]
MRKLRPEELGRLSVEAYKNAPKFPIRLLLDNVRSRYNVGSLLRSADAFRVEKVYLGGYTPVPPHPEIYRSALGAEESVVWEAIAHPLPLLRQLKEEGWKLLALEHTDQSISLWEVEWRPPPWLLIVGNELTGIQETLLEQCDMIIEIPQFGTKHSLNVAVAGGIFLYEAARQLKVAKDARSVADQSIAPEPDEPPDLGPQ